MRIVRFIDSHGKEQWGTGFAGDSAELLEGDPLTAPSPTGRRVTVQKLLAPVVPSNIYCIGANYKEHAREAGFPIPKYPVVFMKPTSAVSNPGDPVPIPRCCTRGPEIDFEGELVAVIGQRAKDVSEDEALGCVAGYTVANDVSARKWQKHAGAGQWIRGKGFDGFCPLGPAFTTTDEIADPQSLVIRTTVNGEVMQEATTGDMIFSVAQIVSYLSTDTTLLPGTLILTGTPWGVGFARQPPLFLDSGDEVVVEVEGIGKLANRVQAV